MKEIRVIVAGEQRAFVTDLLDRVNATGYTIIGNVSGKGHHGVREAHFMFSEQESLEMIMTVVPQEKVEPILAGLRPLFERHSGVMFVADVAVSRQEYFGLTIVCFPLRHCPCLRGSKLSTMAPCCCLNEVCS
jgi:nitrogen regulatory protein PII